MTQEQTALSAFVPLLPEQVVKIRSLIPERLFFKIDQKETLSLQTERVAFGHMTVLFSIYWKPEVQSFADRFFLSEKLKFEYLPPEDELLKYLHMPANAKVLTSINSLVGDWDRELKMQGKPRYKDMMLHVLGVERWI